MALSRRELLKGAVGAAGAAGVAVTVTVPTVPPQADAGCAQFVRASHIAVWSKRPSTEDLKWVFNEGRGRDYSELPPRLRRHLTSWQQWADRGMVYAVCPECGQVPCEVGGEYACPHCGQPTLRDA
jgi:hypothetical protein